MKNTQGRSRALGFGVAVAIATAIFLGSGACASNSLTPNDDGIGTKAETCEGCPCTSGDVGDCHKTLDSRPGYLLCEVGRTTCTDGKWGACEGTRQVIQGAGASFSRGLHTLALATDAGGCGNPCSPSCQSFDDNGTDDAGSNGLTLTEGGGITLLGEAGIGCFGPSCRVNRACPPPGSPPASAKTTITGRVLDPNGDNPLPNVYVYVPNATPDPFSPGVAADICGGGGTLSGDPLPFPVQTDVNGDFTLPDVPSGANVPLVIQVGRWRRMVTIPNVPDCESNPLPNIDGLGVGRIKMAGCQGRCLPGQTASPADNIPKIAVVGAGADALQYFLNRMGIHATEFTTHNGPGRVHYFRMTAGSALSVFNYGALPAPGAFQTASPGTYDELLGNPNLLDDYDMVFLSCDGGNEWHSQNTGNRGRVCATNATCTGGTQPIDGISQPTCVNGYCRRACTVDADCGANYACRSATGGMGPGHCDRRLRNVAGSAVTHQQAHENLRDYAAKGGRLFTTHFGREWVHQGPNPAFPGVATWRTTAGSHGAQLNAVTTFPKGVQFRDWMLASGQTLPFAPAVPRADVFDAIPPTVSWLRSTTSFGGGFLDSNITWNTPLGPPDGGAPAGGYIGKATFSDIHISGVSGGTFPTSVPGWNAAQRRPITALNNDESALEYLIFDLSACVATYQGPTVYPGPATYNRVYSASCPAGKTVRWREFSWRGETPGGSTVNFKVGTANTAMDLGSATFVNLLATNWTTALPTPAGQFVAADILPVFASNNLTPREYLAVKITLNPSPTGTATPTIYQWKQDFECIDNQ